jgi:hypothetical protein
MPRPLTAAQVFARIDGRGTKWLCAQLKKDPYNITISQSCLSNYKVGYRPCPDPITKALTDLLSPKSVTARLRGEAKKLPPQRQGRQWIGLEKALAQLTPPPNTGDTTSDRTKRITYNVEATPWLNAGPQTGTE